MPHIIETVLVVALIVSVVVVVEMLLPRSGGGPNAGA